MLWISITGSYVLSVMPITNKALFDAWILANPQKAERIEQIVSSVVSKFRAALLTNSQNTMDADTSKLPQPMVRDAEVLAFAALYQEMEKELTSIEQSQTIRAEISLRSYFISRIRFTGEEGSCVGFPTYNKRTKPPCTTPTVITVAEAPTFTPGSNTFDTDTLSVVIATTTPGAIIRYTTDNTEPNALSPAIISGQALTITLPATLRAAAFRSDLTTSPTSVGLFSLAPGVDMAYFGTAPALLPTAAEFIAWSAALPEANRVNFPVVGSTFTIAIVPGTVNLTIAYPASLQDMASAIQTSTGQQVRLAFINSVNTTTMLRFDTVYKVFQWIPAFPWSLPDTITVTI